jgi:TonB family protein
MLMEAVTDILAERTRPPRGMNRTVAVSVLAHAVLLTAFFLLPTLPARQEIEREVMQISLGGAPGPQAGGMTPMGGRPVQAPPPEDAPRRAAVTAPAPRTPEMTLPAPRTRPAPPRAPVKTAPPEATSRTPSRGAEPQAGSAVAETGARGVGFGLTTGGGGTGGYLDVGNFCCPEYLNTMLQLIQRNWNSRQQVPGQTIVKFTILRDGRITNVQVERPSGFFALDQTAQRALLLTRQLPPLPAQYTESDLTVHLIFRYER